MRYLLAALTFLAVIELGFCVTCYSSNGQSRKPNDNGEEYECRAAAGATQRYCTKFRSDQRPGRIYRECDRVYEMLFGDQTFDMAGFTFDEGGEAGCKRYSTTIKGKEESGIVCKCLGDRCNSGDITDDDVNVIP